MISGRTSVVVLAWLAWVGVLGAAEPAVLPPDADTTAPEPKPIEHVVRDVEGWQIHIDRKLTEGAGCGQGDLALKILAAKLHEISLVVPADKLEALRRVPIWIDLDHPLTSLQYHPNVHWLTEHGYDAQMAKVVHVPKAERLIMHSRRNDQPWAMLHELAHAYHDRELGFDYEPIRKGYERVSGEGLYESVLHVDGRRKRHYALSDHKEYFAEMSEAYFGTNDFYPFVRAELEEADPETFALLREIWGPAPGRQ